jgi:hypothetical protein
MLFDNLLRLLFELLSSESCKTDKAGAKEKHGCGFGYRSRYTYKLALMITPICIY